MDLAVLGQSTSQGRHRHCRHDDYHYGFCCDDCALVFDAMYQNPRDHFLGGSRSWCCAFVVVAVVEPVAVATEDASVVVVEGVAQNIEEAPNLSGLSLCWPAPRKKPNQRAEQKRLLIHSKEN